MKKLITLLLLLVSVVSVASAEIDLTGMSYVELVSLKDQINLAIWNSQEWQEVSVPVGVWIVGKDIPVGHWSIRTNADYAHVEICDKLDESGKDADLFESNLWHRSSLYSPQSPYYDELNCQTEVDYELKEGTFVVIEDANVVFTPYSGKPALGFK